MPVALLGSLLRFLMRVFCQLIDLCTGKRTLGICEYFLSRICGSHVSDTSVYGRIFDEKGPQYIIIPGFLIFYYRSCYYWHIWIRLVIFDCGGFIGLGYGALVPSFQTLAVQSTKHERSGYATANFLHFMIRVWRLVHMC